MEKPLETLWVGLQVQWGRISGNHQGGTNSDSQVDGDSDMAPLSAVSVGEGPEKERWSLPTFLYGERRPSNSCPNASKFSSFLYVPGAYQVPD